MGHPDSGSRPGKARPPEDASRSHPDRELVRSVLAGNQPAARELVRRLTPVIQRSVNAAVHRRGRALRQQVLDLTQDIFRVLFERDGHILRSWQPDRGASLEGMIGLVAERRAASLLSAGKRTGWAEDLHDFDTWEPTDTLPGTELRLGSKQLLERVLDELQARLSDRGWLIFWSLFVEEHDVERVMTEHELSRDAVYTWRSRLQKAITVLRKELESDPEDSSGRRGKVA